MVHDLSVVILTIVNSTYKSVSMVRLLKTLAGKVVILLPFRYLRKDDEHKPSLSSFQHNIPAVANV